MIRAALLAGPRQIELVDVTLASPADDEVALRVEACGVCATNLRAWASPNGAGSLPGAIGHEVVGVVTEVGARVEGIARGERVCIDPVAAAACGGCEPCLADRPWFCRDRRSIAVWGFAEAMVVPAQSVFPVDLGIGLAASLVEPLACGVHAVRCSWTAEQRGGRLDGVELAVLGAGTTGLLALVAAREAGAARVVVVARHEHQAFAADRLGADEVLREEEAAGRLRELRPELVIEAVGGRGKAFDLATRIVAPAGEVVVLGLFDDNRILDVSRAPLREHHYVFPIAYGSVDFELAHDLLAARAHELEPLVTHSFPLSAVGEAFATAADKRSGALRVVVGPEVGSA